MSKFLGIQFTLAAVQYEGIHQVLDNIQNAGGRAICTGLSLVQPVAEGNGRRMPPLDIDGYERLLDRPLWGKRELWLRGYLAHEPDLELFAHTPYHPNSAPVPPELDRELPHKVLAEAHARKMRAYIQISPTTIPGLKAEDQVHYIDGSLPDPHRRVARQGCLNNPAVRNYILALIRDTVRHYPEADGLFLDWVEFTPYDLRDHFSCTCSHCAKQAQEWGYNWPQILHSLQHTWEALHHLSCQDLARIQRLLEHPSELLELFQSWPGWLDFWRFKAQTVSQLYQEIRQVMDEEGAKSMELGANGWCPPLNRSSGMDYRTLGRICNVLRPKLFTFHWSVLPCWYGQVLLQWNPQLPERFLLDTLVSCLDIPDSISSRSFAHYHIPAPNEPHPAREETWRIKIDEVLAQVENPERVYVSAHSYRPLEQWKRMVAILRDSPVPGMWVTRYGYLSDAKLDALKNIWN